MPLPDACPTLKSLLHHLAQKFAQVSDWPIGLPPNKVNQRFQSDLADCAMLARGKSRWEVWSAALDLIEPIWKLQVQAYRNLRRLDRKEARMLRQTCFSEPELSVLTECIQLACADYPTCQLSWPLLEAISACRLDESLQSQHVTMDEVPATFWVEISGLPSPNVPRWFNSIRGLLISRAALFEAPPDFFKQLFQDLSHVVSTHTRDMYAAIAELCENNTPCAGHLIAAIRSGRGSLECISVFLGGETYAPLNTLLRTWQECNQADKSPYPDIEQLTANLAIRLLAVGRAQHWFAEGKQVTLTDTLLPGLRGTLYGTDQGIELRPETTQSLPPWQIEKY